MLPQHELLSKFFIAADSGEFRNQHLTIDTIPLYVFKRRRFIKKKPGHKMVLLTVLGIVDERAEPERQIKSIFKDFLLYAHEINPWHGTYVEDVTNRHLSNFLLKNCFCQSALFPDSYFKLTAEGNKLYSAMNSKE